MLFSLFAGICVSVYSFSRICTIYNIANKYEGNNEDDEDDEDDKTE